MLLALISKGLCWAGLKSERTLTFCFFAFVIWYFFAGFFVNERGDFMMNFCVVRYLGLVGFTVWGIVYFYGALAP